jgi:AcrR family transcriptional regulator
MADMATRMRRAEQVEQNREDVLAAARQVFLERGYAGASLEAIADAAGFSRGVVYSQFGTKAEMFLALLERRVAERAAQNEAIAGRGSGVPALRRLLETAGRDSQVEAAWARVLVEFRVLATHDPELNRRYAAIHEQTVVRLTAVLDQVLEGVEVVTPVPRRALAELIIAMAPAISLERAVNPRALRDADLLPMLLRACGLEEG